MTDVYIWAGSAQFFTNNFHMKYAITLSLIVFGIISCRRPEGASQIMQSRIDSLEARNSRAYKPGLGEFMRGIQDHHVKLWFAGSNENWTLADFEIQEIKETLEDIAKFEAERKEIQHIAMINPAVDSILLSIQKKDPIRFRTSYLLLTKTCNDCHHATGFGFNVIKQPTDNPFPNQDFTTGKP